MGGTRDFGTRRPDGAKTTTINCLILQVQLFVFPIIPIRGQQLMRETRTPAKPLDRDRRYDHAVDMLGQP